MAIVAVVFAILLTTVLRRRVVITFDDQGISYVYGIRSQFHRWVDIAEIRSVSLTRARTAIEIRRKSEKKFDRKSRIFDYFLAITHTELLALMQGGMDRWGHVPEGRFELSPAG